MRRACGARVLPCVVVSRELPSRRLLGRFLAEIQGCRTELGQGANGQCRADDAIDRLIHAVTGERFALKLFGEKGPADFPTVTFSIDQDFHLGDLPPPDYEAGGDWFGFADFIENPRGLSIGGPVANLILAIAMAEDGGQLLLPPRVALLQSGVSSLTSSTSSQPR